MTNQVLVWDLETVPDLACVARVFGLQGSDEQGAERRWANSFRSFHSTRLLA